ncbi:helix-turn-helix transcriptional regulator [Psychrosphaera aquimarina]|uniref:Helix-turn-helix transcriptional regulator n=1 Tax=Psychrosphaera aquimarina TaxID=2044854 RepID=A0ABU3R0S1_9GAMM|nr:helix-turn-helix transcriptional regulator [Psychrosphaera aquimarina]MDU0113278.1 helix-turn-helix transcriptional regulator [Psychrosphaera aquimarina]
MKARNVLDKRISGLLQDKRRMLGVTMLEVARCLGKPHSFVGLVESGKRCLTVGELEMFCNVLCVNMEDVIKQAKRKVMWKYESQ